MGALKNLFDFDSINTSSDVAYGNYNNYAIKAEQIQGKNYEVRIFYSVENQNRDSLMDVVEDCKDHLSKYIKSIIAIKVSRGEIYVLLSKSFADKNAPLYMSYILDYLTLTLSAHGYVTGCERCCHDLPTKWYKIQTKQMCLCDECLEKIKIKYSIDEISA